jgi:hypothetical protein
LEIDMQIKMAHLSERSTSGGRVNFAVFDAKSPVGDNAGLLNRLTLAARANGLKVDQSALAYKEGSKIKYFGDTKLVAYLAKQWLPRWTHTLTL